MEKFEIALSNGNTLTDLTMNGNNYVSEKKITEELFIGGLDGVIITSSDGIVETHEHMTLVQITEVAGDYLFILRDLTAAELAQITMQSNIDYIAMMSGIEL